MRTIIREFKSIFWHIVWAAIVGIFIELLSRWVATWLAVTISFGVAAIIYILLWVRRKELENR